jgi:hypothetical protein
MRAVGPIALLVVVVAAAAAAESVAPPPKPLKLVGDHWTPYDPPTEFPEGATVHVVVRGDTLWDLASSNLGDPYLWPQIWERNPYIKDSHWIYPGDPIVIDVVVQEPSPVAEEELEPDETVVSEWENPEDYGDIEDSGGIDEGVPHPLGSPADVYCFAKLVRDAGQFPFQIVGGERMDTQINFTEGEIVYLDGGSAQGVAAGDRFSISSRYRDLVHPISNSEMGTIYRQVGQLKVLCAQENTSIAEIYFACDPIETGDVVEPFVSIPVPLVVDPLPTDRCDLPNGKPTGYLIYQKDDAVDTATEGLVMLDLGEAEGLYPGMFATIFRENPVAGMPRVVVGEVGILNVYDGYATAKVTRSWTPFAVGYRVELK